MDSVEPVDEDLLGPLGHYIFSRKPNEVVWVPIMQGERVVAGISALRVDGGRFLPAHLKLLEAAAPVVGIALRTMRLHHANELALAQSVRIQELAALAGHELTSVVSNIAPHDARVRRRRVLGFRHRRPRHRDPRERGGGSR
ncbi:MAG: hypothetical protein E6J40_10370 [Chloroflexi bacterium]|nr:MAG: hypothetical protein E6J40_10370 [Chloroflexota bacterium]